MKIGSGKIVVHNGKLSFQCTDQDKFLSKLCKLFADNRSQEYDLTLTKKKTAKTTK